MTARTLMADDEPDALALFHQNFRREIRKIWPDVGVFIITADGDTTTETTARAVGASA